MNTSSVSETTGTFSVKEALSKALPETIVGRVLFFGSLPPALILFAIGVSFLCVSPFSFYLPFLALAGGMLCLRWKTVGLCGSYLALAALLLFYYGEIPFEERLWQMGVVFALAVNFFILLLSTEEIESLIAQTAEMGRVKTNELMQAELLLHQMSQEKEEQQKSFEEEIQRLKEEAEARRIEREQESKQIHLIQSEIELLTSQKAHFVTEAKKARVIIEQDEQTQNIIQDAEAKIESLKEQIYALSKELEETRLSKEELHFQLSEFSTLKSENAALNDQLAQLSEKLSQSENEKASKLKELTEQLDRTVSEKEAELADWEEKKALEARIADLSESEVRMKEALLFAQEKAMTLQASPLIKVDDKKVRQLQGLYNELRTQFEEKARILSQTRKDLFLKEEKLMALEHEKELTACAPDREETVYFENETRHLTEELVSLEEEVTNLEELATLAIKGF
ncbi:MAG: hypothetical protein JJU12_07445 [Chlamydiales bacterium]|nr:hypothetical protein [Chlamydiales bacterium]